MVRKLAKSGESDLIEKGKQLNLLRNEIISSLREAIRIAQDTKRNMNEASALLSNILIKTNKYKLLEKTYLALKYIESRRR